MVNIKGELSKNQTILLVMSSTSYNREIVSVIKKLAGKNVCYVTLNKTSDSLKELFKKNKVKLENIVFIDAISKSIKSTPNQGESVYYVSSPGALTELSISISKFLNHNFDYLIFDSLTNMLIYEKGAPVSKFVSSLVNKIKQSKTKAVFYALSAKEQDMLIKESGTFVDKVVNVK
jgi:poly-D-alanine transfer protein DltD